MHAYSNRNLIKSAAFFDVLVSNVRYCGVPDVPTLEAYIRGGGADEILDYLEVVHVFVRRSHAGGSALLEVG
jgi:hypothetical protein